MGEIKLVASDLDGTLLRPDETVSERTRHAIAAARQAGLTLVLVTGRPPRSLAPVAARIGLGGIAICANGAVIWDLDAATVLDTSPLAAEAAAGLVRGLRQAIPGVLFAVELEHYEKLEGAPLSLVGKANRLATMIRLNLGLAMQGLVVVPLFAGWDETTGEGRIFSYDATGGRYEEHAYFSVGSGSVFARGSLKKLYRPDFDANEAAMAVIQALYDAAEDDSAASGPDVAWKIFPMVLSATEDGVQRLSDEQISDLIGQVVASRAERPDGPGAPLV